jgi:hypothetical protein
MARDTTTAQGTTATRSIIAISSQATNFLGSIRRIAETTIAHDSIDPAPSYDQQARHSVGHLFATRTIPEIMTLVWQQQFNVQRRLVNSKKDADCPSKKDTYKPSRSF